MSIRFVIIALGILGFVSCYDTKREDAVVASPTPTQQKLLDAGWVMGNPEEDLTKSYGFEPVYGLQDNYFEISIGNSCDVAVKIMDMKTNQCIRYVYVAENTTTTVPEIPQGVYYLKLAYGNDWMELDASNGKCGKFTRNVSYERSQDTFDFGVKNSRDEISYRLEINVVDSKLENNFLTTTISEKEFMK